MSYLDINNIEFTVIDTETTGLSLRNGAKLVEIAGVKIYGKQLDLSNQYEQLINPNVKIPYSAYNIHQINNQMVKDSPVIDDIMPEVMRFIGHSIIVGHNVSFDIQFIKEALKTSNIKHKAIGYLDSIAVLKYTYPGLKSYSLDYLINFFNINVKILPTNRHRALFDSMCTAILLLDCLNNLQNRSFEIIDKFTKLL